MVGEGQVVGQRQDQRLRHRQSQLGVRQLGDGGCSPDTVERHFGQEGRQLLTSVGGSGNEELLDRLGVEQLSTAAARAETSPQGHHLLSVRRLAQRGVVAQHALDAQRTRARRGDGAGLSRPTVRHCSR